MDDADDRMSQLYDLQKFCRAERDWLLEMIEALVRLESPTTDKAAVDRCGAELARRLEAIGGRVTRAPPCATGAITCSPSSAAANRRS